MSYLSFHLLFLAPPILLMLMFPQQPKKGKSNVRDTASLPLICLLALAYTTPWDNYLVAKEVWWYRPDRVSATVGYVPIEEYLFFVLQPLLTGLFLYQYLGRSPHSTRPTSRYAPWAGLTLFTGLAGVGILLLRNGPPQALYMGLILTWASPPLAAMWLYDGETLWANRSSLLIATGVPTLYLWGADIIALHERIWIISKTHTLGIKAFGLPIEEAIFFLMTNLLVTQGLLLLLYGSHEHL